MAAVCNGVSPFVFFLEIFFKSLSTVGELGIIDRRRSEFSWAFALLGVDEFDVLADDEVDEPVEDNWTTLPPLASVTTWSGALGGDTSIESEARERHHIIEHFLSSFGSKIINLTIATTKTWSCTFDT